MSEEIFARELDRRADHVHGVPLTVADVRGRARSIQRRRRAGAAAAVAAVVALVVVVPTVLGGEGDRTIEPAPAPRDHPAVLHGGVVTLASGDRVDLDVDQAAVVDVATLTDDRVVLALQDPYAVRVYRPDGSLQEQFPVRANTLTASADHTAVAWIARDYTTRVLVAGTRDPLERAAIAMPGASAGTIDAILDPDHLLVGDYTTTIGEVTPDGFEPRSWSEPLWVNDVSPDGELWAVDLPPGPDEQFGCAALYAPAEDEVVARTCETSALQFSPDGRHLLGARGDNNMLGEVDVVDLDLQPVGTVTPARGSAVSRVAWADDQHLLVSEVSLDDSRWSLLRVELDGSDPELVEGPVAGPNPELGAAYRFAK